MDRIDQLPGLVLPITAQDEVVVFRNGLPHRAKLAQILPLSAAQAAAEVEAHNLDDASHAATAAGLDLLRAEDLAAQKTILGIGS